RSDYLDGDSTLEIFNGSLQTVTQWNRRVPRERALCPRDVGLALSWIVSRQRQIRKPRFRIARLYHFFRKLHDRELTRIAEIHRLVQIIDVHQANQSLNQIFDVTERARLLSLAVKRQRLTSQRLHNEIGNHAAIVFEHSWPIGIEDPCDANIDFILPVIVHHQRLSDALAFVVAGADADRINVAPVVFRLRVDQRIAIHFRRRRLQNPRAHTLREAKHIDRAHYIRLHCLYRVVLVVHRRRGTREVIDLIDFEEYRLGDVMTQQLEALIIEQVKDIFAPAGEEIIEAEHLVTFVDEPL